MCPSTTPMVVPIECTLVMPSSGLLEPSLKSPGLVSNACQKMTRPAGTQTPCRNWERCRQTRRPRHSSNSWTSFEHVRAKLPCWSDRGDSDKFRSLLHTDKAVRFRKHVPDS